MLLSNSASRSSPACSHICCCKRPMASATGGSEVPLVGNDARASAAFSRTSLSRRMLSAAHQVVGCRAHRNPVARQIQPMLMKKCGDAGKTRVRIEAGDVPHIQIDG